MQTTEKDVYFMNIYKIILFRHLMFQNSISQNESHQSIEKPTVSNLLRILSFPKLTFLRFRIGRHIPVWNDKGV